MATTVSRKQAYHKAENIHIGPLDGHLKPLNTIPETAKYLRVSITTLRRWIASGKIRYFQPMRRVLIPMDAITEVLEKNQGGKK